LKLCWSKVNRQSIAKRVHKCLVIIREQQCQVVAPVVPPTNISASIFADNVTFEYGLRPLLQVFLAQKLRGSIDFKTNVMVILIHVKDNVQLIRLLGLLIVME